MIEASRPERASGRRERPFPQPEDETGRLRALCAYEVLDADAEALLDDLTALAAQICEVPIALISLVDAERQWFKSRFGLETTETPREYSFCAHAIAGEELFLVSDATADSRFFDNPLVLGAPEIRFYAGAPLRTPDGHHIGTLCAIDRRRRELTLDQSDSLVRLARQVVAHFEARVQGRELAEVIEMERATRRAAEAAGSAKTAFLAHMSHELRTPLNAVIGAGDLLGHRHLDLSDRELVETIQTGGRALLEVIDEVLDFSRIEADVDVLDMVSFSPTECVQSVVEFAEIAVVDRDIEVSCEWEGEAPLELWGDRGRLRQVLNNLLSNAVKFTDQGSVRLVISSSSDDEGRKWHVRFRVVDTGVGMTSDQLGRAFLPFEQGDTSMSRNHGGTGLGLAISYELVELMGGTLTASSELGVGTIFEPRITFDAAEPGPPPSREAGADDDVTRLPVAAEHSEPFGHAWPSRRVLVAEDSSVNQMVAARMLERLGCRVEVVADGHAAVEAVRSVEFDVVLMDLQMPGMSGFEATRRIRAELPVGSQPRIVAFTASSTVDERQSCMEAGMDAFLPKPVRLRKLAAAVEVPIPDEW